MTIQVVNRHGIPFNVKVVQKGESYGRNNCLTHDRDDALVEFYDARYVDGRFSEEGQFVSRYYVSTLLESANYPRGLCLEGGVEDWYVTEGNMVDVLNFIRNYA